MTIQGHRVSQTRIHNMLTPMHVTYLSAQCRESYAYRSIHMYVVNIKYTVFQYD